MGAVFKEFKLEFVARRSLGMATGKGRSQEVKFLS
jgi:hypothetical protein